MSRKKRPAVYTLEFQESAVRRTKLPGRTVASVAEELNIPAWRLHNWIRESKQKLERSSELDELIKAQQRIKELEQQVEILKKAAAYFAKSLP
jgi:transposase